jgi:hypothetical protein
MRRLRWLIFPILLLGASGVLLRYHFQEQYKQQLEEKRLSAEQVDALFADIALIQQQSPIGECHITHDAAEVLNALIDLDDNRPEHRSQTPPWWADPAVSAALKADNSSWKDHVKDGPRGDLSITRTLLAYDGWDSSSSGPKLAVQAVASYAYPIPNLVPFQTLAKLRLLEGLRSGEMKGALEEVRHLTELVACEEWLVGAMIAVALLGIEADGYEEAVKRGILPAEAWKPVPKPVREAMKREGFGLVLLYAGLAPEGSLDRLDRVQGLIFGRCAAMGEAMMQWALLRAFLGEPWPFELDHQAAVRALDPILATSSCRLSTA